MFKHISRVALAVLVTLALGLGLTAFAGSATAASSCSAQHTSVVKAKKHVKKDKKKLHAAKRHHHKSAVRKAKKHLARDRARLAQARSAYAACLNGSPAPAPAPGNGGTQTPPPASNPVTDQCNSAAGQIAAQDPTGQFASGAAAFCDLLGQVAGASGGDPVTVCYQLAALDPTGQFVQLCAAMGGGLPTGSGLPSVPGLPGLPGAPTADGGLIGDTLGDLCDQIATQDPTDQLGQLCTALHSLPI
jgi:hypothetical protein